MWGCWGCGVESVCAVASGMQPPGRGPHRGELSGDAPEGGRPGSAAGAGTTPQSGHPLAQACWLPVSGQALAGVRRPCATLAPEGTRLPAAWQLVRQAAGDVLWVGRPCHTSPWKAGSCATGHRGDAREGRLCVCVEGAGGPGSRQPARNRMCCGLREPEQVWRRDSPELAGEASSR